MEFLFVLLFILVSESHSDNASKCPEYLQWDQNLQLCRGCEQDSEYNSTLKRCVKMINKHDTCNSGFVYDNLEQKCIDFDECNQKIDLCQKNEYCKNLLGTYKCIVKEYCGQGYEFSVKTQNCIDINECESDTQFCDKNMVCENVPGSFRCRPPCPSNKQFYWNSDCHECQEGFWFNKSSKQCVDVDECVWPVKMECKPYEEICVKKVGLSTCITHCSGGTKEMDGKCYDIDECEQNLHNCTDNQRCSNMFGTFACSEIRCKEEEYFDNHTKNCVCKSGYKLDLYTNSCEDVNECENISPPCGNHGKCVNKMGHYQCICNEGYQSLNGTCSDLNECLAVKGICGHLECENTIGTFKCVCPPGFRISNGNICEDINECREMANVCRKDFVLFNENYQCFNLIGSYKCIKSFCPVEYKTVQRSENMNVCQLVNPDCSYDNNDGCVQQLAERLFHRMVEIKRTDVFPYKIGEIELGEEDFDIYYAKLNVRKAFNAETQTEFDISNAIMLSKSRDDKLFFVYIMRNISAVSEIVLDIYVKSNQDSREKINSFYQFYVFVNNRIL